MVIKKVVALPLYTFSLFQLPTELRHLVYKTLKVRPIKSVKPFGFLDSYIKMFINVEDEMNHYSDFMSSFIFFLKEIRLIDQPRGYRVRFNDFCKMARHLNDISVKCFSRSEKLLIIKTISRFVDDTALKGVDRIKYRILTATTHKNDRLDSDYLKLFKSLSREDQLGIFNLCVGYGRSELEWVVDNMADLKLTDIQKALGLAARNGHIKVLRWLHDTFRLTADDARAYDNYALRYAARYGSLEVLKWLKEMFGLTGEDARDFDNDALGMSAENGHLEVLKWLKETFGLSAVDARADDNYALRKASENGHLEVLKWLKETFGLTAVDARADDNYALRYAAKYGSLEVLKWLKETFGLTVDDARADDNDALVGAAENGQVEVLKCLHDTFDLRAEDARACDNEVLVGAAENGQVEVLKCLHATFGLTVDDARVRDNEALRCAAENGHYDVVDWFRETFGLTV